MEVTCPVGGVRILEPLSSIYDTKRVALSNGVINVRPNVPLKVKVANFGNTEVTLSKGERLGFAIEAPVKVLAVEFGSSEHEEDEKSGGCLRRGTVC